MQQVIVASSLLIASSYYRIVTIRMAEEMYCLGRSEVWMLTLDPWTLADLDPGVRIMADLNYRGCWR